MTFKEKINIVVGKPVVKDYKLLMSETAFKQLFEKKVVKEKESFFKLFSRSTKKFIGNIHGFYGREFTIIAQNSFRNNKHYSNFIKIHGKIEPVDENLLHLNITFKKRIFIKYAEWAIAGTTGLPWLFMSFRSLVEQKYEVFLMAIGFLLLFCLFFGLLILINFTKLIGLFEKHFVRNNQE